MIASTAFLIVSAIAGAVVAQTADNATFNPGSVDITTRQTWCHAELDTCTQVCGGPGQTNANNCDATGLTFNCTCINGTTPDVAVYAQSLPALICQESVKQCVDAHPNDLEGITSCRDTDCGNATINANATTSSTTSSSAPSATGSPSGSASQGSASSSTSKGAAAAATAMVMAQNYGTGVLAAGMMAVFGLAL